MADTRVFEVLLKGSSRALGRAFERAQRDTNDFRQRMGRAMAATRRAVNTGLVAAGAALVGLATKMVSTGDQFDKMSKRTGVSVEQLQRLRFAAEQSGSSVETLEKGLKRQAKFLADADRGLATYTRQLDELGLSVADFEGLSPDEAFAKFADAIAAVDDPLRQAALAQEVFGRAGTELLPLMKEGSAGIKALGDQAAATGNIMSTEAAAKSAELVDALNELKHSGLGVAQELLVSLLPSLIKVAEFVRDHVIPAVRWMLENWEKVGIAAGVVALAIGAIPAALVLLGSALAVAWNKSQTFRDIVSGAFRAVTDYIGFAVQTQLNTLATLLDGLAWIADKFTWLPGRVGDAMSSVSDALSGAGDTLRGWGNTVADTLDNAAGWVEGHAERSDTAIETMVDTAEDQFGRLVDAHTSTYDEIGTAQNSALQDQAANVLSYSRLVIDAYDATAAAAERAARIETDRQRALEASRTGWAASYADAQRARALGLKRWAAGATEYHRQATQAAETASSRTLSAAERLAAGLRVEMVNACGTVTGFKECVDGVVVEFDAAGNRILDDAARLAEGLAVPIVNACGTVTGFKQCVDGMVVNFDANMNRIVEDAGRMADGVAAETSRAAAEIQAAAELLGAQTYATRAVDRTATHIATAAGTTIRNPHYQSGAERRAYWDDVIARYERQGIDTTRAMQIRDSIPAMARGGIVRRPTLVLAGEAGPERIEPLGAQRPEIRIHQHFEIHGSVLTERDLKDLIAEATNEGLRDGSISADYRP